jgi:VanZ family protein
MKVLAFGYAIALFVALLCADTGMLNPIARYVNAYPALDNLVHFFMYGGLALAVNAAWARARSGTLTRAIVTGSTIVLIASTVEELTNLVVPYRGWATSDLAANYLGIMFVGVLPAACFPERFASPKLAPVASESSNVGAR